MLAGGLGLWLEPFAFCGCVFGEHTVTEAECDGFPLHYPGCGYGQLRSR
jgi:hypothetical protein